MFYLTEVISCVEKFIETCARARVCKLILFSSVVSLFFFFILKYIFVFLQPVLSLDVLHNERIVWIDPSNKESTNRVILGTGRGHYYSCLVGRFGMRIQMPPF